MFIKSHLVLKMVEIYCPKWILRKLSAPITKRPVGIFSCHCIDFIIFNFFSKWNHSRPFISRFIFKFFSVDIAVLELRIEPFYENHCVWFMKRVWRKGKLKSGQKPISFAYWNQKEGSTFSNWHLKTLISALGKWDSGNYVFYLIYGNVKITCSSDMAHKKLAYVANIHLPTS